MKKNTLSIIIPAHDEEASISAVIDKCIEARGTIYKNTSIKNVEIIVVNDGSTDRTEKIAKTYEFCKEISLISYKEKKSYGAALKMGISRARGNYISFIDADSTYDPEYFVNLFNNLENRKADISIGSRMTPANDMPIIRKFSNLIGAFLITVLSQKRITDIASGMVLINKEVYEKILPLPDGLDFTLAITVKGLMSPGIKIIETFVPYRKRVGKSKLNFLVDGPKIVATFIKLGFYQGFIKSQYFCTN
ncbi:MAG: glycosyltransferase family 2 protein [Candidatus Omnitrophica bacterium]|nr:glycosyltransferase family 2 protein [Candidatus Omnitrophota bacterium]